jgi:hypothetical protein
MPFKSERQRRMMWAKRPDVARQWTDRYGSKPQPKKAAPKKKGKR